MSSSQHVCGTEQGALEEGINDSTAKSRLWPEFRDPEHRGVLPSFPYVSQSQRKEIHFVSEGVFSVRLSWCPHVLSHIE